MTCYSTKPHHIYKMHVSPSCTPYPITMGKGGHCFPGKVVSWMRLYNSVSWAHLLWESNYFLDLENKVSALALPPSLASKIQVVWILGWPTMQSFPSSLYVTANSISVVQNTTAPCPKLEQAVVNHDASSTPTESRPFYFYKWCNLDFEYNQHLHS